MDLNEYIRDVVDYPKKGIIFKDLTPLWKDKDAFHYAVVSMAEKVKHENIDLIVGAESRGFLIGAALAFYMGKGFITVRKPNKLPCKTISAEYELEYGKSILYMHEDAIKQGDRVLIVDDLIATGGTAVAMIDMAKRLGGEIIGSAFVVELAFLNGRQAISDYPMHSLLTY